MGKGLSNIDLSIGRTWCRRSWSNAAIGNRRWFKRTKIFGDQGAELSAQESSCCGLETKFLTSETARLRSPKPLILGGF